MINLLETDRKRFPYELPKFIINFVQQWARIDIAERAQDKVAIELRGPVNIIKRPPQ
ncbi:hypothetical protein AA15669_0836 [Saccharibacter floricola DSM 15669]|uniref:Uncharacterized protein n=1 Tax=Saccharibacter floricola DSM 15669 TaxID=1123227 RepID=A0ABQ0NY03_9PROT|nr:hypothetical protein AA15669_0836 [Saccharibacter floricola DSM 15669]